MGHIISGVASSLVSPGLQLGTISEGMAITLEENGSLEEFCVAS